MEELRFGRLALLIDTSDPDPFIQRGLGLLIVCQDAPSASLDINAGIVVAMVKFKLFRRCTGGMIGCLKAARVNDKYRDGNYEIAGLWADALRSEFGMFGRICVRVISVIYWR